MAGPAKRAVAIRHVAFEDLGLLAPILTERGYDVEYVGAAGDDLSIGEIWDADLVVVLGGPIGAYEEDAYPFLTTEIEKLEKRLAANRPTLGLCLGAQLMARALGVSVYPAGGKEIGWAPVTVTEPGRAGPVSHLAPERTQVLHWHGDTFDLPAGAERLASTQSSMISGWSFEMSFRWLATDRRTVSLSSVLSRSRIGRVGLGSRISCGMRNDHGRRGRDPSLAKRRWL